MIITNIIGGLGNQMFQYAAGLATARATAQQLRFAVDSFDSYKLHNGLQLEQAFALQLERASTADIRDCIGLWRSPALIRRLLTRLPRLQGTNFLSETSQAWGADLRSSCQGGAYLHGHWQSECYFADHADAIRQAFRWRGELQGRSADVARSIAASPQSISLHVRRGDYISNPKNHTLFATCTPEYYVAAVERVQQCIGTNSPTVFAFSDDPNWVMQSLSPKIQQLVLVDHNRQEASWLDMRLMSLCRHHVIANSSFSWWGAWLNARADAQVIAPKKWFANGQADQRLVPARWQRV